MTDEEHKDFQSE